MEISEKTKKNKQHFDVVISGGGLSGSLMALSLLSLKKTDGNPLSIAIVEANYTDINSAEINGTETSTTEEFSAKIISESLSKKSVFDERVLALSHASADYLKTLKVWPLLQQHAQPITHIHISDRGYYGKARITAEEHNVSAVGYVIEMSKLGLALHQAVAGYAKNHAINNSTLTWFTPDSIECVEWQSESVNITLASTQQLSASLLIGCDGAHSVCRQAAQISCDTFEYNQFALITNVSTALPHNGAAFERFTKNGPIAMLPMVKVANENSRCSLVWTLTPEQANEMKSLTDNEFKVALEQAFGSWLGAIDKVGKRHVFPLLLVQAKEQIYHRMALIGNASHTIHPIAGQGFNLGLRDVKALTQTLKKVLANNEGNKDIGAFNLLTDYAESRKKDHKHIITLTDSLVTLFSNDLFPLVAGRNIGLKVLNYVPAIKNTFVNKTMGY